VAKPTQTKVVKHIRKGVAIYKTERSPFWFARIWNPKERKYLVRSTKETARIEAADAATELADSLTTSKFKNSKSKKPVSFVTYAEKLLEETKQRTKGKMGSYAYRDEHKILYRKDDGLITYFGDTSVAEINAGSIRSFVTKLDQKRSKPLANSTKAKNLAVLKRVLELALDDDVIPKLPRIPRLSQKDNPRATFTLQEYRHFIRVGRECATEKHKVRSHTITNHDITMFLLMVHSYLRPTQSELFGLRRQDISYVDIPDGDNLKRVIQVRVKGKTGYRTAIATPRAHLAWNSLMMDPFKQRLHEGDKFLLMEKYENRKTAVQIAGLIFKHIVRTAKLEHDALGQPRTMYSLRHFAIQERLRSSSGKVNIYWLAQNAGTSVNQLERFYLRFMDLTAEQVSNLHYGISPGFSM
jgi:hypothetical protein